jgi:CheY-like chemotaxis protein
LVSKTENAKQVAVGDKQELTSLYVFVAFAAIFFLNLLLRVFYLRYDFVNGDEGVRALTATRLLEGARLYADVVTDKPPGATLFYAAVFALAGRSMKAVHVAATLWNFATAMVVYLTTARAHGKRTGLWAALLFVYFTTNYFTQDTMAANTELLLALPYTAAFACFMRASESDGQRLRRGLLLVGADSDGARALVEAAKSRVQTFGTAEGLTWQAHDLEAIGSATRFKVRRDGRPFGVFELPLVGAHNVRNALAAIAVATEVGISIERIASGLRSFAGVKRRLEVVGTADDERSAAQWLNHSANACDLVIIDIFLKSGSGLGVLQTARHVAGQRKLVVLSNYATPDMRRKCLQLGADKVFDKSNEIDGLISYCSRLATGEGDSVNGALS